MPHGVAVLTAGVQRDHQENAAELVQLVQLVREQVGPVANFKQVAIASRRPKARSEKVLRGTMRQIADAQPYLMPATIDDPLVPDAIKAVLRGLGYAGESKSQIGTGRPPHACGAVCGSPREQDECEQREEHPFRCHCRYHPERPLHWRVE